MKLFLCLQSLLLPIGAGSLALMLGLFGWKREVLRINVRACDLPWSFGFQVRWYYSAARDFLAAAFNCPGPPIHVRPRDQGKLDYLKREPTLFLTAHVHNWERLAAWMPRQGIPLLGAARTLSSPLFDRLLTWVRARNGIPVVTRDVLSGARAHLRKGGCFGILWDQHSPLSRHTSLLFGMPVAMDPLPEILLRRYGPRVVVGFLLPSGCFRLVEILGPRLKNSPEAGIPLRVQEDLRGKPIEGRREAFQEAALEVTQGGTQEETHGKPHRKAMREDTGEPNGEEPKSPARPSSWMFRKAIQEHPRSMAPLASQGGSTGGVHAEPGNETEVLLYRMTRRYHRVLESVVLAYPHLWYGFAHRRFKGVLSYPSVRPYPPSPPP